MLWKTFSPVKNIFSKYSDYFYKTKLSSNVNQFVELAYVGNITKIGTPCSSGLRLWLNFFSKLLLVKKLKSSALICQLRVKGEREPDEQGIPIMYILIFCIDTRLDTKPLRSDVFKTERRSSPWFYYKINLNFYIITELRRQNFWRAVQSISTILLLQSENYTYFWHYPSKNVSPPRFNFKIRLNDSAKKTEISKGPFFKFRCQTKNVIFLKSR